MNLDPDSWLNFRWESESSIMLGDILRCCSMIMAGLVMASCITAVLLDRPKRPGRQRARFAALFFYAGFLLLGEYVAIGRPLSWIALLGVPAGGFGIYGVSEYLTRSWKGRL